MDYACDNMENALKCAAGHMSGRSGYINMTMHMGKSYDMTFDDRVSPPLRDLVGRSILLVCEDEDAAPKKMCAPVTSESLSFSLNEEEIGWTAGGVMGVLILIFLICGIGSAYYYGKTHGDKQGVVTNSIDHKFAALGSRSPTSPMPVSNPVHTNIASSSLYAEPQSNDVVALQQGTDDDDEKVASTNEGGGYVEEEEEVGTLPLSPAPEPEMKQYETVTKGGPIEAEY